MAFAYERRAVGGIHQRDKHGSTAELADRDRHDAGILFVHPVRALSHFYLVRNFGKRRPERRELHRTSQIDCLCSVVMVYYKPRHGDNYRL